jgi:hypothetical protein
MIGQPLLDQIVASTSLEAAGNAFVQEADSLVFFEVYYPAGQYPDIALPGFLEPPVLFRWRSRGQRHVPECKILHVNRDVSYSSALMKILQGFFRVVPPVQQEPILTTDRRRSCRRGRTSRFERSGQSRTGDSHNRSNCGSRQQARPERNPIFAKMARRCLLSRSSHNAVRMIQGLVRLTEVTHDAAPRAGAGRMPPDEQSTHCDNVSQPAAAAGPTARSPGFCMISGFA